jgi:transposase-like protein
MPKCEYCGREHNGTYSTGRFCTESCARGYAGSRQRGIKKPRYSIKRKFSYAARRRIGTGVHAAWLRKNHVDTNNTLSLTHEQVEKLVTVGLRRLMELAR